MLAECAEAGHGTNSTTQFVLADGQDEAADALVMLAGRDATRYEAVMTIRNLQFMLAPRSVVLVGASDRPGSIGRIVAENLAKGGFTGGVHLVNPKRSSIRTASF